MEEIYPSIPLHTALDQQAAIVSISIVSTAAHDDDTAAHVDTAAHDDPPRPAP